MTLLEPSMKFVPGGRIVYCSLYDSNDPSMLTQDLLLVSLPGDTYVDVTWAPEHDVNGNYYITVLRGHSELITDTCRDPYRAIEIVERFAEQYSERIGAVACSTSETVVYQGRPAA